ncbi:hypothetical protein [Gilvimarinus chinensis]|uniref:hypothetical protein n=1 Tax=Gilvimarinus chinensis TaxID=396005 RepID=UPI00036B0144|nr:hypothetical protein [Gilvimarinus chinensis]
MDLVRVEDINGRFLESAHPVGRDCRAWVAAVVISLLAHAFLGWLWKSYEPEPKPTKTVSFKLQLQTARTEPSSVISAIESESQLQSSSSNTRPKTGSLPEQTLTSYKKDPPKKEVDRNADPAQAEHVETPSPVTSTPSGVPSSNTKTVFDPRLRAKLDHAAAATPTSRYKTPTYTDVSGSTRVELGEGRCLRSKVEKKRGFSTDWYLTGCKQQQSEGDVIIQGLERKLRR